MEGTSIAKSEQLKINDEIDAHRVRLIGADGSQLGIVSVDQALETAAQADLDLVEIAPTAEPPVCRVMDYGKHLYNESKKKQAARRKQKQIQVKEIKFRPRTDEGDYQVKLKNLLKFLENGDKAKVTLRFRGREFAHQELGMNLLERIAKDLEEVGSVEQFPKMEGRQLVMVLSPKR